MAPSLASALRRVEITNCVDAEEAARSGSLGLGMSGMPAGGGSACCRIIAARLMRFQCWLSWSMCSWGQGLARQVASGSRPQCVQIGV